MDLEVLFGTLPLPVKLALAIIGGIIFLAWQIVIWFRTGKKPLKKSIEEVKTMIIRSNDPFKADRKDEAQTFSEEQDVYALNDVKNVVEKTGEKVNVQKLIQSELTNCISEILAKYLPEADEDDKSEKSIEEMRFSLGTDLDRLTELGTEVQDLAGQYGLPETATLADLNNYVTAKLARLNKTQAQKAQGAKQEEKKEVIENAQAQVEQKSE